MCYPEFDVDELLWRIRQVNILSNVLTKITYIATINQTFLTFSDVVLNTAQNYVTINISSGNNMLFISSLSCFLHVKQYLSSHKNVKNLCEMQCWFRKFHRADMFDHGNQTESEPSVVVRSEKAAEPWVGLFVPIVVPELQQTCLVGKNCFTFQLRLVDCTCRLERFERICFLLWSLFTLLYFNWRSWKLPVWRTQSWWCQHNPLMYWWWPAMYWWSCSWAFVSGNVWNQSAFSHF